jgi:hypothetical protein
VNEYARFESDLGHHVSSLKIQSNEEPKPMFGMLLRHSTESESVDLSDISPHEEHRIAAVGG